MKRSLEESQEYNKSPLKKAKHISYKAALDSTESPDLHEKHEPQKIKTPKKIQKTKILDFLKGVMHLDLQNSLLTDIVFSDKGGSLTVVGRTKLDGVSKQLNHVIPVSFIKNLIDASITKSVCPKTALNLLSNQITILAHSQEGFAITSKQLEQEEYSEIAAIAPNLYDRQISTSSSNVFLFSPGKKKKLFNTPTKQIAAKKEYPTHNKTFISKAMELFAEAINETDENTATIACEALARFIFIVCSKGQNISFASEGNTLRYEIRLYDDPKDAKEANNNYSVVKSRELKDLEPNKINECIRIVNCEGTEIKKTPKALKILNDIIEHFNLFNEGNVNLLETYNLKHNSAIILSNYEEDISIYNAELTIKNYTSDLCYHVAKQLYLVFDLKALEDVVFVPAIKGNINAYTSSKGTRLAKYSIVNGEEYREGQLNSATEFSNDNFFRSRGKDLTILPQKIVELFIIGTMPFAGFTSGFFNSSTKFLLSCLEKLITLAAFDYCLKDKDLAIFQKSILDIYTSWTTDNSIDSDLEDTFISLSGNLDFPEFFN